MKTAITLTAAIIIALFGGLLCFLAWNGFAQAFNLPQFSYWHWVVTYYAIRFFSAKIKSGE